MKTYTIAEINDLDHGIPISRFEGRIKKVFDQKQGEGQYGTWYLQNLIVEDGHQEITVTWTGDDPFDAGVEGQTYSFETGYDKKDKPVGIVRDIRTKNGKKYEGVKVDNRSKIKRVGEASYQQGKISKEEQESDADTMFPQDSLYDTPEKAVNTPPSHPLNDSGVTDARKHLCQSANLYILCVKCVNNMIAGELPEIARTSEQFQAAVGTLFIEASRAGFVGKMPEKPIL